MFAAPGIFIAKADHVSIYSPKKEQVSQPGVVGMHKEQATHRRRDGGDIYDFLF
jgi:hypothetical protein